MKTCVHRLHGRRRGLFAFTLIELLIATAVFAMVLVVMNTVFAGALSLRKTTVRTVEESFPVNRLIALMKSDLRSMIPPGATGVLAGPILGGRESALQGGSSRRSMNDLVFLEFTTTSGITDDSAIMDDPRNLGFTEPAPWPEAQKVNYYLREPVYRTDALGMELVRTVTRNLLAVNEELPYEQPLLEGVEAIEFLFYDGTTWMDTWNSTNQDIAMPQAIKVTIDYAAPTRDARFTKTPVAFVFPILTQTVTNLVEDAESADATGSGDVGGGGTPAGGGQQGGGQTGGGGQPGGGGQQGGGGQPPGGGR